jgi:alkylated DNA repair dioxygenase AlkB
VTESAESTKATETSDATHVDPAATFERIALDKTSWVDISRNWLLGSNLLFDHLYTNVAWQSAQLFRYEQFVEERRLGAGWRRGQPLPHPVLADVTRALQRRYKVEFPGFGMIQYRDGNDGQGFHRDTDMRWLDDTVIAILTLGAQRPWLLRPKASKHVDRPGLGATHDLAPGCGDLLVMGGRSQADWEHSVAYLKRSDPGVRISLQWRFARKTGEPFKGASYRADLSYGKGRSAPQDR